MRAEYKGSNGSIGSRPSPPTATWNLPAGKVLPIPTRPKGCSCPGFDCDIAVNIVPARPTLSL